jgi:hypothetical protein
MMIAWRPVRPTHKLSAHAVPCTAIRHTLYDTHRHPELSDSAEDDVRMTMCLYVCRNAIASLTALLSLLRTQSSCYHLVTSTYMFGDCVIRHWKVLPSKSTFHLWFIPPKSSSGNSDIDLGYESLKTRSKIRISSFVHPSKIFVWHELLSLLRTQSSCYHHLVMSTDTSSIILRL